MPGRYARDSELKLHDELVVIGGSAGAHRRAAPREKRFRPAIDPLFRSAAKAYGERLAAVLLSGCKIAAMNWDRSPRHEGSQPSGGRTAAAAGTNCSFDPFVHRKNRIELRMAPAAER